MWGRCFFNRVCGGVGDPRVSRPGPICTRVNGPLVKTVEPVVRVCVKKTVFCCRVFQEELYNKRPSSIERRVPKWHHFLHPRPTDVPLTSCALKTRPSQVCCTVRRRGGPRLADLTATLTTLQSKQPRRFSLGVIGSEVLIFPRFNSSPP